jgi:hypothetical protein
MIVDYLKENQKIGGWVDGCERRWYFSCESFFFWWISLVRKEEEEEEEKEKEKRKRKRKR